MQKQSFSSTFKNYSSVDCKGANYQYDYYPFGSPMQTRNWSSGAYRFGFNGQEKDDEINGICNIFTADYWEYDSRIGKRWNLDPKSNHSISNYSAFLNNPIVFVDPNGTTEYFNSSGQWIGTDGKSDGINVIVNKNSVVREIKKSSRKGMEYKKDIPNGNFIRLPSKAILNATVTVFDLSLNPTKEDPDGGKHEVSTYYKKNMHQSPYLIGTDVLSEAKAEAQYKTGVKSTTEGAEPPKGYEEGAVSIHSHPTEIASYQTDLNAKYSITGQAEAPSPNDLVTFQNYELNIIVGKTGELKLTTYTTKQGNIMVEKVDYASRNNDAHFFNRKGEHLYQVPIETIRNIITGKGKENRTFKKYNKKHGKT